MVSDPLKVVSHLKKKQTVMVITSVAAGWETLDPGNILRAQPPHDTRPHQQQSVSHRRFCPRTSQSPQDPNLIEHPLDVYEKESNPRLAGVVPVVSRAGTRVMALEPFHTDNYSL